MKARPCVPTIYTRIWGLAGLNAWGADISGYVACGRVLRAGRPPTLTVQTAPSINGTGGHLRRKLPIDAKLGMDRSVPRNLRYSDGEDSSYEAP
jgi:hypothetical protein